LIDDIRIVKIYPKTSILVFTPRVGESFNLNEREEVLATVCINILVLSLKFRKRNFMSENTDLVVISNSEVKMGVEVGGEEFELSLVEFAEIVRIEQRCESCLVRG
jgi:hypothetical protein